MRRLAFIVFVVTLLLGCAPQQQAPARVLLEADGTRRLIPYGELQTVGDVLTQQNIVLAGEDRVEPASFTLLTPNLSIRVVRVREREIREESTLPFGREVKRDASLPQGESRLLQLGENGREEITVRLTLENNVEVAREIVARQTLQAPTNEVYVMGTRGSGTPVAFEGTIVYLEGGNAWLMREDSSKKRALTLTGDLDGLVFALSPDGRWLLFSRAPIGGDAGQGGPLNSLWMMDTRIVNEEPKSLDIGDILWAEWQPCAAGSDCPLQVAFSTGVRVPTPPGWRANNDLKRFGVSVDGIRGDVVPVLDASHPLFGWWGRTWAWSPNGDVIAWADATRVGTVSLSTRQEQLLAQFQPFETRADWVWTPQLAWSPDGKYVAATVHRTTEGTDPTASVRFDLLRFEPSRNQFVVLEDDVGPFAFPEWISESHLIFGQVEDPANPITSRYSLMSRQGTAPPQLFFPAANQPGMDVPLTVADPNADAILTLWQGDLYLISLAPRPAQPLTNEGGATLARWAR